MKDKILMEKELQVIEKVINSSLSTGIKSSSISFDQLTIEIEIENINKTILFLKISSLFVYIASFI